MLKNLIEKYVENQRELHRIFTDLEKAYGKDPKNKFRNCMRISGIKKSCKKKVRIRSECSGNHLRIQSTSWVTPGISSQPFL